MLNAFDEFFVPAIAPVAWNVVIIAVLVGAAPFWHSIDDRLYAYAIGILLGTVVQFALPLPWLRGRGGRFSLTLSTARPAVRRVFVLMLPVTLGLGLINVNLLVDTWFATRVNPELAPGGDRQGVPHLHAAAGHVLGGRRDGRVPGALALRRARATGGSTGGRSRRGCGGSRSCSCRPPSHARCSPQPMVRLRLPARAVRRGPDARWSPRRSRRSRSG